MHRLFQIPQLSSWRIDWRLFERHIRFVLADGIVAEQGTHGSLMGDQQSVYKQMIETEEDDGDQPE